MFIRKQVVFFILLLPSLSFAETIEEQPEYVVSASLTPIKLTEMGSSFSIITSEDIENRNLKMVSDLLREIPGYAVNRQGPVGTNTQVRVRGAEANQLLVLIDGVEANDVSGGSEFDFAHLSTQNIERIEILRGAQSALWGSDAIAGVVNIITKRGQGEPKISGFMEAGSFGTAHGGGSISSGNDYYDIFASATHLGTNGSNIAPAGEEDDGYRNTTYSLKAGLYPSDFWGITLISRYTGADSEIDNFVGNRAVDDDRLSRVKQTYVRLETEFNLFDGNWSHTVGSAITKNDRGSFISGVENSNNQSRKIKVDYKTSLNLETAFFTDVKHSFSLAVDNEKDFFKQAGQDAGFGDPDQDRSARTTGYTGEYRVGIAERLFLSGSIRHDDNTIFPDSTTQRFTLALLPVSDIRIHSSYGTGVKNPTFIERFGFSSGGFFPFTGNPDLKPEKSKTWDVGFAYTSADDKYSFDVTYFKARLKDEINGFVFLDGGTATAQNVSGTSLREGVEISAVARINEGLTLAASYTNLDATQPDSNGVQIKEVRRPENIASFNLNQKLMDRRLNLNLGINYNGSQTDSDFSAYDPVTETFDFVRLSSFVLVNFSAKYDVSKDAQLYGRIENLLDEKYQESLGFNSQGIGGFAGINLTLNP